MFQKFAQHRTATAKILFGRFTMVKNNFAALEAVTSKDSLARIFPVEFLPTAPRNSLKISGASSLGGLLTIRCRRLSLRVHRMS